MSDQEHKQPVLEPAIIDVLEDVLEERKTRKDRRQGGEAPPPEKDRRTGGDRRNKD